MGDGGEHHKLRTIPLFCSISYVVIQYIKKKIQKPERLPLCSKPENTCCVCKSLVISLLHTHTHTHTLCFHVLWGLSIDIMVFILSYTVKTSLSLIYKLVSSWGPKNVPTRTRISDIAILVGTFCPHNVGFTSPHTHTDR